MSLTYEEKEYCKVHVAYHPPVDVVEQKREQALEEVYKQSKNVAIKGFRKGKASLDVVRMHFKKQIEDAAKQKLVSQALDDFVFETKAKTIFYPDVKVAALDRNNFDCEMVVLKKPDFELKKYKGFEIPRPHVEHSAAELVEKKLQELRVANGDVEPFSENDFVQEGDKITMDVKCVSREDSSKELTNQEGVLYEVGSHQFHEEMDDNILGMKAGESRSFDLLVNGERSVCTVFVHMGVKKVPCPLDDELGHKTGCKDLADLRSKVEGFVTNQLKNDEVMQIQQQIVQRLLNEHTFQVPSFLIDMDAEKLAAQFGTKLSDLDNETRTRIRSKASDMVKLTLIMDSIRESEPEAAFSEREIMNHLRTRLTQGGQDPEKYIVEAERSGKLYGTVAALQHQATMEWLVANSTIID